MNRSITIRTGLRLRHLGELEDLDVRTQHLPLGLGGPRNTALTRIAYNCDEPLAFLCVMTGYSFEAEFWLLPFRRRPDRRRR
jgi:hypothetical protein